MARGSAAWNLRSTSLVSLVMEHKGAGSIAVWLFRGYYQ